jgi:ribosomal protein S27AE
MSMMEGLFVATASQGAAAVRGAQQAAEKASGVAAEVRRQHAAIRLDVEKLFMITEALWGLLKEQHGYEDEQLARMIEGIDLRDGKLDGRVARQNPDCPQCGRTLLGTHPVCLYCGTAVDRGPFDR